MSTTKIILLTLAVMVALLAYPITQGADKSFWENVVSGMLATMFGVIVGLPFAFFLARQQERTSELKANEERTRRRNTALQLLQEELQYDLQQAKRRVGDSTSMQTEEFKDELWKAFTASGELALFDDPALISSLSTAYSYIGKVKSLESMCYTALRGINCSVS
jgi:hypothetical protein